VVLILPIVKPDCVPARLGGSVGRNPMFWQSDKEGRSVMQFEAI